jgi:hypothetical protein
MKHLTQQIIDIKSKPSRKPSQLFEDKVNAIVNSFGKLKDKLEAALFQGRKEGMRDSEIYQFIRQALVSAGYSRMTISRYLPPEVKDKPRNPSNKMLQSPLTPALEISPQNYRTEDLQSYPRSFLLDIIHWYESIYQKPVLNQIDTGVKSLVIKQQPQQQQNKEQDKDKNYFSPQLASNSPRSQTINAIIKLLESQKTGNFSELVEQAAKNNNTVANYIGDKYQIKHNMKLRPILQALLDHDGIKRVEGEKQVVLAMQ